MKSIEPFGEEFECSDNHLFIQSMIIEKLNETIAVINDISDRFNRANEALEEYRKMFKNEDKTN